MNKIEQILTEEKNMDDLIISIVAKYCDYKCIESLFIIAGSRRSIKDYYQLFGEIYCEWAYHNDRELDVILFSAKYSYYYAVSVLGRQWPEDSFTHLMLITSYKYEKNYLSLPGH